MFLQDLLHQTGDIGEFDSAFQKQLNSGFISGTERGWIRTACFGSFNGQFQAGESPQIRRRKG